MARQSPSLSPHYDRYQMVKPIKTTARSEARFMVKYGKLHDKETSHRGALASARGLYSQALRYRPPARKGKEELSKQQLRHNPVVFNTGLTDESRWISFLFQKQVSVIVLQRFQCTSQH